MQYDEFRYIVRQLLGSQGGRGNEALCVGNDGRFALVDMDIRQMVDVTGVDIPADIAAAAQPYGLVTGWH